MDEDDNQRTIATTRGAAKIVRTRAMGGDRETDIETSDSEEDEREGDSDYQEGLPYGAILNMGG